MGNPRRWLEDVLVPALSARLAGDAAFAARVELVLRDGSVQPAREETWHLEITGGAVALRTGRSPAPQVIVELDVQDLAELAAGALDPRAAWIDGRLSVAGDAALIARLGPMLAEIFEAEVSEVEVEVAEATLVVPCLDEAATLGALLDECSAVFAADAGVRWTVLIADNGSRDESVAIAQQRGVRVVHVPRRGYGAAVDGGVRAAESEWVVYADADGTYDPRDACRMLAHARATGADLVVGSRFAGSIAPGAMPALHRYLGTPVLSAILRVQHGVPLRDVNSGLRCVRRAAYLSWGVDHPGMELASGIIVAAAAAGARIEELPISLRAGPPGRTPHLRPWRDGLRHLGVLLGPAVWRTPLVIAVVLAAVWSAELISGEARYSDDVTLRLQTEAFLRGELSLQPGPRHHLRDWAWSPHGMQQLWGLGVPLLRLPFELAARALGSAAFPDRLVLVVVLLLACGWWARGCTDAVRSRPLAAALAAGVFLHPALLALLSLRFAVYEEVVAAGVWIALAQLGLLAVLEHAPPHRVARPWLVLAGLAALSPLVRPTGVFFAVPSVVLGAMRVQGRLRWLGIAIAAVGPIAVGVTNTLRFGHPLEFGYALNLSMEPLNELSLRFGSPFASVSIVDALRELGGSLFFADVMLGVLYAEGAHAWEAPALRFREHYFPTFGVLELLVVVAGVVLAVKMRRRPGAAGVWSRWALLVFAGLCVFYVRAPSMTSRYVMDFYPAIAAFGAALAVAASRRPLVIAALVGAVAIAGLTQERWGAYSRRKPIAAEQLEVLLAERGLARARSGYEAPSVVRCPEPRDPSIPADGLDWSRDGDCTVGAFTNVFLAPSRCVVVVLETELPLDEVRARADYTALHRVRADRRDGVAEVELCADEDVVREGPSLVSIAFFMPRRSQEAHRDVRLREVRAAAPRER